jgi:hypothetical protein
VIGPFWYLIGRSTRNQVVRQVRRLRQPRYLVALGLGLAYLWFLVVRQRPTAPPPDAAQAGLVELAGAVAAAGAVVWAWVFASDRRILAFSPAEVTFLFPAPISRRELIHFKLLRNQLIILLNTFLWTFILSRERLGASVWLRVGGVWVLLTTLSLHRLGASFVRGSLVEHGGSGVRRRALSLAVLAAALLGLISLAVEAGPMLAAGWHEGVGPFLAALEAALERPVAKTLLAPFRAMVGPLTASGLSDWGRAMVPALAILAAHYVWVIRSDAAFEEAAAEASLRKLDQLAQRAGRRRRRPVRRARPPYPLVATGTPAGAIVWKNLVGVSRTGRPRAVALALAAAGAVRLPLSFRAETSLAEIGGWFALMWAGFLLLIGPQWIRSDLRGDLAKLDLLRSYPLPGRAVVGAEVAASTLILSALQLAVLAVGYLAFLGHREMEPGLALRSAALAGAVVILPTVNFLGLLIHNGAAILYPAWITPASGRPGGIEALGQNMLAIIAYVGLLSLTLVPPVAIGAILFLSLREGVGWWAAAPAAAAGLVAAAAEARVMINWLGRIFERTDPAAAGVAA